MDGKIFIQHGEYVIFFLSQEDIVKKKYIFLEKTFSWIIVVREQAVTTG